MPTLIRPPGAGSQAAASQPTVFVDETSHHHKKSKKKRRREEDSGDDQANDEGRKRRKKKHKKNKEGAAADEIIAAELKEGEDNKKDKEKRMKKKSKKYKSTADIPIELSPQEDEMEISYLIQDETKKLFTGDDPFTLAQLSNNDDILRAIQGMDVTSVKGLGLPSVGAQINTGDIPFAALLASVGFNEDPSPSTAPPKQKTTKTTADSSTSRKNVSASSPTNSKPKSVEKSKAESSKPLSKPSSVATPEHTRLLATKWLSSDQLKKLVETEGLVYKKGKFSAAEEQALQTAIENYRTAHGMTQEQLVDVIFAKVKHELHNNFWYEIANSLPARPLIAIYHRVQRNHHPLKLQGKWSSEEDVELIKAVADLGSAWTKISDRVGRAALDCRDRWRNHLSNRKQKRTGKWTKEEEDELTRIVLELTEEKGQSSEKEIFWTEVSKRMGETRGRQQCRAKWTDSLSRTVKAGGDTSIWTKRDGYNLVQKIAALDIKDTSEVNWKSLATGELCLWSGHVLQRRFRTMKRAIKGYEAMKFKEIIETLLQKNAEPPKIKKSAVKLRKNAPIAKQYKSAAIIEDELDSE